MNGYEMKPIARIQNDFKSKFGIPRQSGLVEEIESKVVLLPPYNTPEALRGLEGFSHIWLIWLFSQSQGSQWSPTVRPPRLGGNKRVGVFATRSPFRPNSLGLSCVRLNQIRDGVLIVSGADLMDGTPILDIKPYLPIADCKTDATSGFAAEHENHRLETELADGLADRLPPDKLKALTACVSQDPRPAYQDDSERIYGFLFGDYEVKFKVYGDKAIILDIIPK